MYCTVFYLASSYNQPPFCSPLWVDSTAEQSQMFEGARGSIAGSACCPAGTYWIGGSSKCTDCAAGKYNDEEGKTVCTCLLYTSPSPRD